MIVQSAKQTINDGSPMTGDRVSCYVCETFAHAGCTNVTHQYPATPATDLVMQIEVDAATAAAIDADPACVVISW